DPVGAEPLQSFFSGHRHADNSFTGLNAPGTIQLQSYRKRGARMLRVTEVERLRCPSCRGSLAFQGRERGGYLHQGRLDCGRCVPWAVEDGLCRLYREELVRGNDKLLRYFYD